MTDLIAKRETATPGATSQNISMRLKALSVRPQALTVQAVIDRYMAQYAGRDPTRMQRLSAWLAMIGEFTLEQVDSDLIHVCRSELQTKPPLVFVGLDHLGQQIFKVKGRAGIKSGATINRYMVAISAVFTWAIEQRLSPKGWVHPCRGIKRLPDAKERVRYLDAGERTRLYAAVKASEYLVRYRGESRHFSTVHDVTAYLSSLEAVAAQTVPRVGFAFHGQEHSGRSDIEFSGDIASLRHG